jgi:predicted Zn finger-like uncharacterized protein
MMEVACAVCGAAYRFAPADLPPAGTTVTCAKCKARIVIPARAAGATGDVIDLADLPAPRRGTAPPSSPVETVDLPAPKGPRPSPIVDLPAPKAAARTPAAPRAPEPFTLDGVELVPAATAAPGSTFGPHTNLPAPKAPAAPIVDLPAPKGPAAPIVDLPAPKSRPADLFADLPAPKGPPAPIVDLPAPKGPPAPIVDLPAPKGPPAPIVDLPAPKGPPALPDLPTPKRAGGDAAPRPPAIPIPKPPAPPVAARPVVPPVVPPLASPTAAAKTTVAGMPSPRAPGPGIDLPAPKGFFDDLPAPVTTPSGAGADLPAPKGFFDDLPGPAMSNSKTLDLPAPKGFFDDLPGPAMSNSKTLDLPAPKGFFDDLPGPAHPSGASTELAPKGFFDDLPAPGSPASPSLPAPVTPRASTAEALSLFDDLGPPVGVPERADRFAASAPAPGALDAIDLPMTPGMSGLLELESNTASARSAVTSPPMSARAPASDAAPPLELGDADPLGLELPTATAAVAARGGVSFKTGPAGGGVGGGAPSSTSAAAPELDLALDRRREKAEANKTKPARSKPADDAKPKLSPRATRLALAAALGLAAVGAGGFVMYRRWDAQQTRAATIERNLAAARKAIAGNERGHWRRAVRAAGDVLALDKRHREALAISAQATLAAYFEEGTEGPQRTAAAKRFLDAVPPGGERLPALTKAEALRDLLEGDTVGAIKNLTPLAADPDAQLYRGWAHAAAGQWAEAITAFTAAQAARPAAAHYGLAQAQAATGALAEAHANYLKVIELDPEHVGAQVGEAMTAPGVDGAKREASLLAILQRQDIAKADPRAVILAWTAAGDEARRAGRRDAARDRYRKALALSANDAAVLVSLAATELADGKLDAAHDAVTAALAQAPTDIDGNLTAAEIEVSRRQLAEAATRLSALRERQPPIAAATQRARLEMIDGRRLEAEQNLAAALAAYERAAAAVAGDIGPVIAAATLLGRQAEAAEAAKEPDRAAALRAQADAKLAQIATAAEGDAAIAIALGTAYQSAGSPIQAERWLRGALDKRPTDVDAHYQLAEALRRQGKQDEAVATLVKAFELDPTRVDLGVELARGFEAAGRDADAGELYKRLLGAAEVSVETKVRAGRFFARTGDIAAARKLGDELLAVTPDDPTGLFLKAEGLLVDRRPSEARRILQEVVARGADAQFLDALGRACEAFAAPGNDTAVRDEALRAYEQVVKLDDKIVNAWVGIGRIRLARGEYERSLTAYEEALRLAPDNPDVPYGMGKAYVELEDRRNAIVWLSRAVAARPIAGAYWELGKLYYESDKAGLAAAALDKATKLATQSERDDGVVVPWLTDALWLLGTVQQVVRNDAATVAAWQDYLDRKPQNQAQVEEVRRFLRARGR